MRRVWQFCLLSLSFILATFTFAPPDVARSFGFWQGSLVSGQTTCHQPPTNPHSSEICNLDRVAADWGVFCEGMPTWRKENVATPSIDGESLRVSLTDGGSGYSNAHFYREFAPEPNAVAFTLSLSFRFDQTTCNNNQGMPSVVQALEFTMNKWQQALRYEFALQWQNVGDGAPQWRYWDPHRAAPDRWVPFNPPIIQCLAPEQWHTLTLEGEINNGRVRYRRFTINQQSHNLNSVAERLDLREWKNPRFHLYFAN